MSIYVIQAGDNGPIKIGSSMNPKGRLGDLQTGNHNKLELLCVYNGKLSESKIQNDLSKYKILGEWFKPHNFVLEYIANNVTDDLILRSILKTEGEHFKFKNLNIEIEKVDNKGVSLAVDGFHENQQHIKYIDISNNGDIVINLSCAFLYITKECKLHIIKTKKDNSTERIDLDLTYKGDNRLIYG